MAISTLRPAQFRITLTGLAPPDPCTVWTEAGSTKIMLNVLFAEPRGETLQCCMSEPHFPSTSRVLCAEEPATADPVFTSKVGAFLRDKLGVHPNDIAPILATFITVKYATWALFVAGGVRYQPLSRLFRGTRVQMVHELARTKDSHSAYARFLQVASNRGTHVLRKGKVGQAEFSDASSRVRATSSGQSEAAHASEGSATVFTRLGNWYGHYSEKLATRVAANKYWASISSIMGMDPRKLALGLAEGVILYKLTFPITGPLGLYFVVKYYQHQRTGKPNERPQGEAEGSESRQYVVDELATLNELRASAADLGPAMPLASVAAYCRAAGQPWFLRA
jgi:hypothetical protein